MGSFNNPLLAVLIMGVACFLVWGVMSRRGRGPSVPRPLSPQQREEGESKQAARWKLINEIRSGLDVQMVGERTLRLHSVGSLNQTVNNLELVVPLQITNSSAHEIKIDRIGWELWLAGMHVKSGAFSKTISLEPDSVFEKYEIHEVFSDDGVTTLFSKRVGESAYLEGTAYCETPFGKIEKLFTILGLKVSISENAGDVPSISMRSPSPLGESEAQRLAGYFSQNLLDTQFQSIINDHIGQAPVSIFLIDIDGFGAIAQAHGRPVADEVLRKVDFLVKNNCGEKAMAMQYGDDEFCVILTETPLEKAKVLAEKIRHEVENAKVYFENKPVPVTVSIGVATLLENASYQIFIRNAADMLRLSREKGGNRVSVNHRRIFDPT